jgi:acetylornithine/N-succinyldiaminopimelate aminotransferase
VTSVLDMSAPSVHAAVSDDALLPVYRPNAPLFVAARECTLIADDGREYLDFGSGIAVNALGYGDAGVRAAFDAALDTGLIHTSNLYRTVPSRLLAQALVEASFADRVFFCNSGGESNEAAFKFARRFARESGGDAKHEIVAMRGSFHGRLFGTMAATDRPAFREQFQPVMPGVHFVTPGDIAGLRAAVSSERTAAIIAEPVQGESGVRVLDTEWLRMLRTVADEAGALLIFDEVQTGLGRTGTLFAYEHSGVTPDILTLAKPLAGGLPMGAVLVSERVAVTIRAGDHATTFGGGALVSTVALEVMRRVSDPSFLAEVREKGQRILDTLASLSEGPVMQVRGRGLMWGIELNSAAAPYIARALDANLLILSAGENVLRLLPPLVIDEADLDRGLAILKGVLS